MQAAVVVGTIVIVVGAFLPAILTMYRDIPPSWSFPRDWRISAAFFTCGLFAMVLTFGGALLLSSLRADPPQAAALGAAGVVIAALAMLLRDRVIRWVAWLEMPRWVAHASTGSVVLQGLAWVLLAISAGLGA